MKHFIRPVDEYERDINVLKGYMEQQALYLSRMTGRDYETCHAFVAKVVSGEHEKLKPRDPAVLFLNRNKVGDREQKKLPLSRYFQAVEQHRMIIAPTMTTYLHPDVKRSLLSEYVINNLNKRKEKKADMFKAKMEGDSMKENFFNLLQATFKIKNNSISGAHASPYQILYNKSSHSTLTSTCRTATSYANANNEKFLMGNRHYWSPEIVRANILSICSLTDRDKFKAAMKEFNLVYPTTEQALAVVRRSADLYWIDDREMFKLGELLGKLEPVERAMFVYVGDLYHLAQYNPEFVRTFLTDMSRKAKTPIDNPDEYIKQLNGDATALVCLLNSSLMDGRQLKKVKEEDPKTYAILGHTAKLLLESLDKYKILIRGLWVTPNLPSSIYKVPSIYRRCAIVSDTDSTIFTNQYWTNWYVGKMDFSEKSYDIGYTTTFLTSQIVVHFLAVMSSNMGVEKKETHRLTMKSEFYFPTLALTSMAKNYFSFISAQEGNVFQEMDMEIKGVALKSSNWPGAIAKKVKAYMAHLMRMVMEKGKLSYHDILRPVYDVEMDILNDIAQGGYKYLTTSQIKDTSSYVDPTSSPYQHYELWRDVFAPKYGDVDKPPYQSVKVNTTLERPSDFKRWLEEMEDKELANRIRDWCGSMGKDKLPTMRLPEPILQVSGIPKEIIDVVDTRRLLFNTVSGFYLVIGSMGLTLMDSSRQRFVSDFYEPDGDKGVVEL